jgi:hypothetical protein
MVEVILLQVTSALIELPPKSLGAGLLWEIEVADGRSLGRMRSPKLNLPR